MVADGFAEVDDVDQIALAVDVRPHFRVPPAGPVAEVDAGLDEVLNLNDRHAQPSCPPGRGFGVKRITSLAPDVPSPRGVQGEAIILSRP